MKRYKISRDFAKCFLMIFLSSLLLFGCTGNADDEPLPTETLESELEETVTENESQETEEVQSEGNYAEEIILEEVQPKEEIQVVAEADDSSENEEDMVWIPTKGGKKYHSSETCSNMSNPQKVTIKEAEANGFSACKRCYS